MVKIFHYLLKQPEEVARVVVKQVKYPLSPECNMVDGELHIGDVWVLVKSLNGYERLIPVAQIEYIDVIPLSA